MIVKMIGVINSSIRFEGSIRKRIGQPIRFEIRFERKKSDSQVPSNNILTFIKCTTKLVELEMVAVSRLAALVVVSRK